MRATSTRCCTTVSSEGPGTGMAGQQILKMLYHGFKAFMSWAKTTQQAGRPWVPPAACTTLSTSSWAGTYNMPVRKLQGRFNECKYKLSISCVSGMWWARLTC